MFEKFPPEEKKNEARLPARIRGEDFSCRPLAARDGAVYSAIVPFTLGCFSGKEQSPGDWRCQATPRRASVYQCITVRSA
jgi:hypothetical protein